MFPETSSSSNFSQSYPYRSKGNRLGHILCSTLLQPSNMIGSLILTYRDNTLGSRAQGKFTIVQLACALWGEPCDKNGITICSLEPGNIKSYLQTQLRFHLQHHCKLLPSAVPSMSNFVVHSSIPCYSPLNLVCSPNPMLPLSPYLEM
jgi:hypothetical protein